MRKLHITQDDFGFWELSLEEHDGTLRLLAYRGETPDHLIENAHELVTDGRYPDAVVVVDPPRRARSVIAPSDDYDMPEPRKAGE
jgi:hypothetical protein